MGGTKEEGGGARFWLVVLRFFPQVRQKRASGLRVSPQPGGELGGGREGGMEMNDG